MTRSRATAREARGLRGALAWALGLAMAMAGCTETFPLDNALMSFDVRFSASFPDQLTGSPDAQLPYVAGQACTGSCPSGQICDLELGRCVGSYLFDIEAIGRDGGRFPYAGPIHIRVTPGRVLNDDVVLFMTPEDGGVLTDVPVYFAESFGKTHIWFEADGYVSSPFTFSQCSDGIDNDNNGLVDLADPGCLDETDAVEAAVSMATGVSPTLHFADPTLQEMQQGPLISSSPLVGEQVQVTRGTLIVSNVVGNGFYVIDLDKNQAGELYNGLFVFTFSKPQGISYLDPVCRVAGSVQEFVGMTQVSFPSYSGYDPDDPDCAGYDIPAAQAFREEPVTWDVTDALLPEGIDGFSLDTEAVYANSLYLESLESNLVTFDNLQVATRFIACDANDNGTIDPGTPEIACRNGCQRDALCTDLESYFQFAQYSVVVDGKKKIYGSLALADDYIPLEITFIGDVDGTGRCTPEVTEEGFVEYTCEPTVLESLTGSLRHIYLCGNADVPDDESDCTLQFWVVDPRFDGDVVVAGQAEEDPTP